MNNTNNIKIIQKIPIKKAALRALQDKIRRLEAERTQALDETTQLKHQLKHFEIEADHNKQRDQLASQKTLQEAKNSYERLLGEKSELEMKINRLEDKNKANQKVLEEFQSKNRFMDEEKHSLTSKLKDLELQQQQLEQRIKNSQIKEKGFEL